MIWKRTNCVEQSVYEMCAIEVSITTEGLYTIDTGVQGLCKKHTFGTAPPFATPPLHTHGNVLYFPNLGGAGGGGNGVGPPRTKCSGEGRSP